MTLETALQLLAKTSSKAFLYFLNIAFTVMQKFTQQKNYSNLEIELISKTVPNSTSVFVPTKQKNYSRNYSLQNCTNSLENSVGMAIRPPSKSAVFSPQNSCPLASNFVLSLVVRICWKLVLLPSSFSLLRKFSSAFSFSFSQSTHERMNEWMTFSLIFLL